MRKLYSFALAVAVVLSASATSPSVKINADRFNKLTPTDMTSVKKLSSNATMKAVNENSTVAPLEKVDGVFTIDGDYTLQIGDWYAGEEESTGINNISVTLEYDGGQLWMNDNTEEWFMTNVPMTYTSLGKTVTISAATVGAVGQYYIKLEPFKYNYNTGRVSFATSITGKFDTATGVITFGDNSNDYGLAWNAYSDANYSNLLGQIMIFDIYEARQFDPDAPVYDEEQEGQWKNVGTATFVDAWITPSYSMGGVQINPNDYPHEVELHQSVSNENVFRLWEPYKNAFIASQNQSLYHGQIVFDITDPENVVVFANGLPCGFKNAGGEFYLSNSLGWYMNYLGGTREQVLAVLEQAGASYVPSTYSNGVVTITEPLFDRDDPTHSSGYTWQTNPYYSIITLPDGLGVNDIVNDDLNGAVRYYNLQGVEIANPAQGSVVIKVQGNTASKLIVR